MNKNPAFTNSVSDRFFSPSNTGGGGGGMKRKNFILDCVQKFIHLT